MNSTSSQPLAQWTDAPATERMTYMKALRRAVNDAMTADERVFVLGEDVREGIFGVSEGLVERFGGERVRDTPISEGAIVGATVGAAMCGLRPLAEMTISTFAYVAMDQLVNQAAKNHFLFGAQASIPAVFHFAHFHRSYSGAQHTDRPHPMLMNVPGLKIVAPATPADAYGLMAAAIADDDPVVFFSDMTFWGKRGEVPAEPFTVPIGMADVAREGSDVTIVAIFTRHDALKAASLLEAEGISAEVIDPRTLAPLDTATILDSVRKTGRVVVVDTAHDVCSAASHVAAVIAEEAFESLRAPILRVTAPQVHIPYAPAVEPTLWPDADKIAQAVRRTLRTRPDRKDI